MRRFCFNRSLHCGRFCLSRENPQNASENAGKSTRRAARPPFKNTNSQMERDGIILCVAPSSPGLFVLCLHKMEGRFVGWFVRSCPFRAQFHYTPSCTTTPRSDGLLLWCYGRETSDDEYLFRENKCSSEESKFCFLTVEIRFCFQEHTGLGVVVGWLAGEIPPLSYL